MSGSLSEVGSANFEKYTLHALEAFLRGEKWAEVLRPFFQTNSPRFQHFNQVYLPQNEMTVTEIDIQMHSVHIEFITLVESELFRIIGSMGISEERLIALLDDNLQQGDETVERLHRELVTFKNFVSFGIMMQRKYTELYVTSHTNPVDEADFTATKSNLTNNITICRVLWDLENVPVIPQLGGIKTVMQLQEFLKRNGFMGPGVDTRITAFLNPFNRALSKKTIEELNKASVELVCASSKREDADRKLGIRINQEMQLLNAALTTFIIISSDQDFRQHIQLLANAGYKVVIIHDAKHESWRNTLEMHATQSFDWSQVVSVPPIHPTDQMTTEISDQKHTQFKSSTQTLVGSAEVVEIAPVVATRAPIVRDPLKEALSVGWRVATCQRWSSAFGFLFVDVSHPAVNETFVLPSTQDLQRADVRIDKKGNEHIVRVYVHASVLAHKPAAGRMLRAGEYVLVHVEIDVKGPRATVVKELIAAAIPDPNTPCL